MTDEIQRTSPAPWLIGGAAVGGTGAGVALTKIEKLKEWTTEPKYASHEDILKEKHDTLVKQAEEASEESKNVWDEIVKGHKEIEDAEATWETQKNEYVKNNSVAKPVEDTEEIKNLNKTLEELKTKVEADKKKFIEEEKAKLSEKKPEKAPASNSTPKKVKNNGNLATKRSAMNKKLSEMKAKHAQNQSDLNNLISHYAEQDVKIFPQTEKEEGLRKLIDSFGLNKEEADKLYDVSVKEMNTRGAAYERILLENKGLSAIDTEIEAAEKALKDSKAYQKNPVMYERMYADKKATAQEQLNKLQAQKDALDARVRAHELAEAKNAEKAAESARTTIEHVYDGNGRKRTNTRTTMDVYVKKEYPYSETERALVEQYNSEVPKLKETISQADEKLEPLKKIKELKEKRVKTNVDNAWNVMKNVEVPKSNQITKLEAAIENLGKEPAPKQVVEEAKEVIEEIDMKKLEQAAEEKVKAQRQQIDDLTSQIATKREALPKQAVKTAEELATEYATKNPKEAFVKTTTENVTNRLKDSLEQAMKETTKRNGLKFWGPIAGAAVGLGLLAAAIRPKTKSQA